MRSAPELPSVLQAALGPGAPPSSARLILCGSSLGFMGGLLSGSSPLRGQASLELLVRPALGEAKLGTVMGEAYLDRLRHVQELLGRRCDVDVSRTRLLCFSGAGFDEALRRRADAGDVVLVDLERLYIGS